MDRSQLPSLVTALNELSWSDVKQMAIFLDESIDLPLLTDIEREYPIEERLMYTMKAWLEKDCEASWAKVVSALRLIGKNVLAKKIDEKRSITENEATVISIRAFDHSASVIEDGDSDRTRAQETTEQETSDCPVVTQQDSEISGWRRDRRQMISYIAIMAAIVGAALAAAESGENVISLVLTCIGFTAAMVAFGVKLCIVLGVPTGLRKLAVFAAGAAVVVAVLVGAPTSAIAPRVAAAIVSVIGQYISVMRLAVGVIMPLIAAAYAVFTTEAALPVLVTVAVTGAVTIWAGTGVMVGAAVTVATAAIMAVAAAGAATAREPSQAAVARAAAAAVVAAAVAVVTAAVGAPVLKSAAGLAAVVAVAVAVAAVAAAAVAVGSFPAVELAAAAVTVGTVIVAEAAAIVTAVLVAVLVVLGPPSPPPPAVLGPPPPVAAAVAAVLIIAVVALELASKLHYYLY